MADGGLYGEITSTWWYEATGFLFKNNTPKEKSPIQIRIGEGCLTFNNLDTGAQLEVKFTDETMYTCKLEDITDMKRYAKQKALAAIIWR
tara:strand:- start:382 stop:651 length:270 start_codon:yes stop_codon:yes gene_type:complete